jgi:hypothetical protein
MVCNGLGANPLSIVMTTPEFRLPIAPLPGFRLAGLGQVAHGTDVDTAKYLLAVTSLPPDSIKVDGMHAAPMAVVPSYHNGEGRPVNVTVTPSYRRGDGTVYFDPAETKTYKVGKGSTNTFNKMPATVNDGHDSLADYTELITPSGPMKDTTGSLSMTMAFLGNVDGVLTEADLSAATQLFTSDARFLVPALFSSRELFGVVDLTQWLSFPSQFEIGETFTIEDGVSPVLPGFEFSTSPFELVVGEGFVATGPLFDGTLTVEGGIDGSASPEPSTWALLGSGIGWLVLFGRLRKPWLSSTK